MDSLFDLLLTLAPISLFIALKIYASRKQKAEEGERVRLARFLAEAAKADESPRPTFAQLSALADEAEMDEDPRVDSEGPVRGAVGMGIAPAAAERASLPLSEVAPPMARPTSRGAPRSDRLARLERMSPLKRAVVMAELLGPPRGL